MRPIHATRSSISSARYYRERHAPTPFDPDRDPVRYAGRVFGEEEMRSLVDSSLDFYLTASRFTEEFEAGVADYLGPVGRPLRQLGFVGEPRRADRR